MKKAEIFATLNTEKVLQNKRADECVKKDCVYVKAVKNSYETSQIIITPNFNVSTCEISLNSLKSEHGYVFGKKNIEIFYQKYIEVKKISDKETNGQLGWFPDLLLPYSVAVKYGENRVCAGNNQGIIFVFHITKQQRVGVYKGKIVVKADGEILNMPIRLEVCDIALPDVTNADSLFCMEYEFVERAEKDKSLKMKEAYAEALMKYKQVPRHLPQRSDSPKEFCRVVRKYYHRISGFCIPMDRAIWWGLPRYIDYGYFRANVLELAKACLYDGVNYFEKARNYLMTVDEPLQTNRAEMATIVFKEYRTSLSAMADEVEKFDIADGVITKSEIADTIRNKVYGLLTSHYTDKISGVEIWCPVYKHYANTEECNKYKESGRPYWGYTCNAQNYPLPNYHIDDMNSFLSARVLGSIMKNYGVSGNLYYETVFFEQVSYKGGLHLEPTDPYENSMKYPGTNGDGFLFYPGIKYGLKEPLVSNRLLYIRDASQDYDLLRVLESKYKEQGVDPDGLLESIYALLHTDTRVNITGEDFFALHDKIIYITLQAQEGKFYNDIRNIN